MQLSYFRIYWSSPSKVEMVLKQYISYLSPRTINKYMHKTKCHSKNQNKSNNEILRRKYLFFFFNFEVVKSTLFLWYIYFGNIFHCSELWAKKSIKKNKKRREKREKKSQITKRIRKRYEFALYFLHSMYISMLCAKRKSKK